MNCVSFGWNRSIEYRVGLRQPRPTEPETTAYPWGVNDCGASDRIGRARARCAQIDAAICQEINESLGDPLEARSSSAKVRAFNPACRAGRNFTIEEI